MSEKYSILIVDDEKSNIDALVYSLSPMYAVYIAKDGGKALKIANDQLPDLILLDILMPGISGFEVLAKLKESDRTRNIPVIFITGLDSIEDEERGFFLGAVDYITKPFHNSIVRARVKTHLQIVKQIRTIEQLSMIDSLTDIPNRRSFNSRLEMEWKRSIREKTPISMLMLDIDDFKRYNDIYGHSHGDVLLYTIARVFTQSLRRPADFAARWGGEEFAVLLPDTGMESALEIAEHIRANTEQTMVPFSNEIITSVTVSIGAHTDIPGVNSPVSSFLSEADKALYAAKKSGKNKVCPSK